MQPRRSPAHVCEVLRIDPPYSLGPIEKASAWYLPFGRRVFFAALHGALDRTGIYPHAKATSDGFDDGFFALRRRTPLLHEIQDLVGALMGTPRAALTRQKPGKALGSKMGIRDVERLPAKPKRACHRGDGLALNTVPAKHFVAHLEKIAGIEEIIRTESFVLDFLRVAMEWMELLQGLEPRIAGRLSSHVTIITYISRDLVRKYFSHVAFK